MFWNNLNEEQSDEYWRLVNACKPYIAWCSLSNTKKAITPKPDYEPTDDELHRMEILAMVGWGMI